MEVGEVDGDGVERSTDEGPCEINPLEGPIVADVGLKVTNEGGDEDVVGPNDTTTGDMDIDVGPCVNPNEGICIDKGARVLNVELGEFDTAGFDAVGATVDTVGSVVCTSDTGCVVGDVDVTMLGTIVVSDESYDDGALDEAVGITEAM